MDIKLNLINRSNDANNSQIVIFQKNAAAGADELPVAWQVIRNLGRGDHYPFVYPLSTTLSAADSWGNYTPQIEADNGQLYSMMRSPSDGDMLSLQGKGSSPHEIQCRNDLAQGAISASLFKSGKLVMIKTSIAPGQLAAFVLQPTLYIGVIADMEAGEVMDSAIMSNINTELSLLGVSEANIIMTGGGPGQGSASFQFTLENVVTA